VITRATLAGFPVRLKLTGVDAPLKPFSGSTDTWFWDMGLRKNIPVTEKQNLQFRFEVFKILNHPNWGGASSNPTSGSFGMVTGKGGNRTIQLALKYIILKLMLL